MNPKLPGSPQFNKNPRDGITLLSPIGINTPFGKVSTPAIELPPLRLPDLGGDFKKTLKQGLGADVIGLAEKIPYVGSFLGPVSDAIKAMHYQQIAKELEVDEFKKFLKWDKSYPTTLALVRIRLGGIN